MLYLEPQEIGASALSTGGAEMQGLCRTLLKWSTQLLSEPVSEKKKLLVASENTPH